MTNSSNAAPQPASATATAINPLPVGAIIAFGGSDAPNGWLLCNGQSISQSTYPNLFAVIGGTVPDLRSRFVIGAGQGQGLSNYPRNATGGLEVVQLSTDQIPPHQHFGFGEAYSDWPLGLQGPKGQMGSNGGKDNDNYFYGTTNTGGGQSHENRPPYYALTYIIKY